MGGIFVSHSSRDDAAASELRDWLTTEGHQAIFLDHHAADGIAGGVPWEEQLYTELRRCRALVALVDRDWLESPWCVAEADHAQALRKPVLPLLLRPIDPSLFTAKAPPVLRRTQAIDWHCGTGCSDSRERLRRGLLTAGLDPKNLFVWHGDRAPYPGLASFQQEDAAVYFGREQEITDLLAALRECRAPARPRLVLVQGASGTGKSSLLRAGMLPRLARDADNWIVVPPFRPLDAPLANLAEAFAAAGADIDPPQGAADGGAPGGLVDRVRWLQQAAGALRRRFARPEATVLVPIDQLEEVLGRSGDQASDQFLLVLRDALAATDHRLLAVATLRADFTGTLQRHPALREPAAATGEILATRAFQIGPLPRAAFHAVIDGPAALASLELESGLASRLVDEAQTDDALPLLAFVLRELWDRFGVRDSRLTHAQYQTLGGLEAAVGDRAEKLVAAVRPSKEELEAFREILVFGMAELSVEGRILRRRLPHSDVPASTRRLVEEFARARLLVTDESAVEVAHEALFRRWTFLQECLDAARDSLAARRRLGESFAAWVSEAGDRASRLLPAGRPLEEAKALLDRTGALTDPALRRYVEESAAASADAQRRERRRRRLSLAAVTGGVLLAAFTFGLYKLWSWTDQQRALTETAQERMVAAVAERELAAGRGAVALSVALEGAAPERSLNSAGDRSVVGRFDAWLRGDPRRSHRPDPQVVSALRDVLRAQHEKLVLEGHAAPVISGTVSGDGTRLLTAGEDGTLALWDLHSGNPISAPAKHGAPVVAAALDAKGRIAATASTDNRVQVWDTAEGRELPAPDHPAAVLVMVFLPRRGFLASGALDGRVRIWDPARPDTVQVLARDDGGVIPSSHAGSKPGRNTAILALAVSPDESLVASASLDGFIAVWDLGSGQMLHVLRDLRGVVQSIAFSPDGTMLVAASNDHGATLWDPRSGTKIARLEGHEDWILEARFSPKGGQVLTASVDRTARLWDVAGRRETCRFGAHEGIVSGAVFAAEGRRVVTASYDGVVRIWDTAQCLLLRSVGNHTGPITHLLVLPDGETVATLGADRSVRIWSVQPLAEVDSSLVPSDPSTTSLVEAARRLPRYILDNCERNSYLAETKPCATTARDFPRFADPRYIIEALSSVLDFEGGFVDAPAGGGSAVNEGITQRVYDAWRQKRDLPLRSVREISTGEVQEIYRTQWWTPAGCDGLPLPLAWLQFDTAVNMGINTAVKFLQENLGVPPDGIFGPQTRDIIAKTGQQNMALRYLDNRIEYYKTLAQRRGTAKFLSGWLTRVAGVAYAIGLPQDALPPDLKTGQ